MSKQRFNEKMTCIAKGGGRADHPEAYREIDKERVDLNVLSEVVRKARADHKPLFPNETGPFFNKAKELQNRMVLSIESPAPIETSV